MKKLFFTIYSKFLTAFGNIRISKYFPWLYYDTTDFKITGKQIIEIMNILKPGDIILRGYDSYLDGCFIPDKLKFSHGAIYIGNNIIIHAIAEGVQKINVIDFCQCDRIAIFKPITKKYIIQKAIRKAKSYDKNKIPYDFYFSINNKDSAIYCFELINLCYPSLNIKPIIIKKLFNIIKKHVFIAESIFKSKNVNMIYQYNPKFNISINHGDK